MKKSLLLFTASAVFVFCTVTLFRYRSASQGGAEERYAENFHGAREYFMQARVNFNTNRVDLGEVMQAFEQADALRETAKKKNSTGRLYWQELGPDNVGGRSYAILFDKNNPSRIYAGGVSGGLWISDNGGSSWKKYNDMLDNLAVSCIAQASNGDVYFGTGEIAFSGSSPNIGHWVNGGTATLAGKGIWKSTDGGNTFSRLPSTWENASSMDKTAFAVTYKIAIDPNNPSRIYAATQSGLRMSNDGGNSWINPVCITSTCTVKHTADMVDVDVTPTGVVFCVANNGTQLYRSVSGNDSTFVRMFGGIPTSAGRIEVAVSLSNAAYAYASICDANQKYLGVYQSKDSGNTWTALPAPSSDPFATAPPYYQGWYDNVIIVDPSNPERIYLGGVSVWNWSSTDGWTRIGASTIHSDQHGWAYHPTDPNVLLLGNDGGIYISNNAKQKLSTFTNLNKGYNVTQFYAVAASLTGEVMGGTQDNGTPYISGTNGQASTRILGGDGGYADFSTINPNAFFATSQLGEIRRSSNKGASFSKFTDTHVAPGGTPDGGFVTVFRLWERKNGTTPVDTTYFLATNTAVWATKGALDFSKTPKWYKVATLPAAARCIEVSDDGKTVFVGTIQSGGTGHLVRITGLDYVKNSIDTSGTGYDLTSGTPVTSSTIATFGQCVTGIAINPANQNTIVVTLGNYGYASNVVRSYNALASVPSFTSVQNNLPSMPVYSAVIDRNDSALIVLGTELGIFASEDGGTTWTEENTGLARTGVMMVRQQYHTATGKYIYYLGTYGRGIFRSVSTTTDMPGIPAGNIISQVTVSPNPVPDETEISFWSDKPEAIRLSVYDLSGKIIISNDILAVSGKNIIKLNAYGWPEGAYILSVKNDYSLRTVKIIKH